jgi:two-component system, cell cycle response regulator
MNDFPEKCLPGSPTPGSGSFPRPTLGESRVPRQPAILLVEDSPSDALLVREALRQCLASGGTLVEVARVSSALLKLVEERFDLILLDLTLPDSQGIETLRTVREHAPDIPIVVLTGLADDVLGAQAVQGGAQDYLVKSEINCSLLVRSMRHAIERHRLKTRLETTSLLDELSGLHNRRGFLILGKQQIRNAQRLEGTITLPFVDVDRMKQINDRFGHQEGDLALKDTAEILRRTFRQSDILARIGGDEFVAMASLPPGVSPDLLISRLQMHLDLCNRAQHRPYTLSLSVGAETHAVATETSLEELLARADERMYEQKRRKKANHNPSRMPKKKPAEDRKPLPESGSPNTTPPTTPQPGAFSGQENP